MNITTHRAKTLTASIQGEARDTFAWLADPDNLSRWHGAFCRSLRRDADRLMVETPRGVYEIRFVRDDHSLVLDLVVSLDTALELTTAIRVLRNGEGSEVVITLVQPRGLADSAFHEQLRWIESALRGLRKRTPKVDRPEAPAPTEMTSETNSLSTEMTESKPETPPIPPSSRKLFVGNLPFDWAEDPLRELFATAGTVTAAEIARFRKRGRSRGFGFVEMSTEAEAQAAIEKLHGSQAGGRKIVVRLSRPRESAPGDTPPVERREASAEAVSAEAPQEVPTTPAPSSKPSHERRPFRPQRGMRGRSSRPANPRPEIGITNSGGYEIFPRRPKGSTEVPPTDIPEAPRQHRSPIEQSPYFDDTGDIENRGNRRPPRRRGRR